MSRYQKSQRIVVAAGVAVFLAVVLLGPFGSAFIIDCNTSWDILCWFA